MANNKRGSVAASLPDTLAVIGYARYLSSGVSMA